MASLCCNSAHTGATEDIGAQAMEGCELIYLCIFKAVDPTDCIVDTVSETPTWRALVRIA